MLCIIYIWKKTKPNYRWGVGVGVMILTSFHVVNILDLLYLSLRLSLFDIIQNWYRK